MRVLHQMLEDRCRLRWNLLPPVLMQDEGSMWSRVEILYQQQLNFHRLTARVMHPFFRMSRLIVGS